MSVYQRGKVYKLVADETDLAYIGSTAHPYLCNRLSMHKADYKSHQRGEGPYISSFDIVQYPSVRIELIEEYPCESREELRKREQHWKDEYGDLCVNRISAFRSPEKKAEQARKAALKYRNKNPELARQRFKDWAAANPEQMAARAAKKVAQESKPCACGGKFKDHKYASHVKSARHQKYVASL